MYDKKFNTGNIINDKDSLSTEFLNETTIQKVSLNNYLEKEINNLDEIDIDYVHLDKAFTNPQYYRAMKAIPLQQKRILYLSIIENLSVHEIANILNIAPNKVRRLLRSGVKNFKINLNIK